VRRREREDGKPYGVGGGARAGRGVGVMASCPRRGLAATQLPWSTPRSPWTRWRRALGSKPPTPTSASRHSRSESDLVVVVGMARLDDDAAAIVERGHGVGCRGARRRGPCGKEEQGSQRAP